MPDERPSVARSCKQPAGLTFHAAGSEINVPGENGGIPMVLRDPEDDSEHSFRVLQRSFMTHGAD